MATKANLNNLGSPVVTSQWSALDLVSRSWGPEWRAPDHDIYKWNNGRGFDSTDQSKGGVYGIDQASVLVLPGQSGSFASSLNASVNRVFGDLGIIACAAPTRWNTGAARILFSKWLNVSNQRAYQLFINASGGLSLQVSLDGTIANIVPGDSTTPIPGVNSQPLWLYATRSAETGLFSFYTAAAQQNAPLESLVWSPLGTPVAGTAGAIFRSQAALEIGTNNASSGTTAFTGNISSAYIFASTGTSELPVASMIAADAYVGAPGWNSSLTGEQWNLNGNASVQ